MGSGANSKASILIVDDDVLIAESNNFLIKNSGYKSAGIAFDGWQAIEIAREKMPDLIVMDINLGHSIDGITAAEKIQEFADIPFIFLTAYSDPATIERAKKIGPFGYLIKPFDNREFRVAIETTLYKHSFDKKIKDQELLFRTVANFAYEWEFWIGTDFQFHYCSPSCKRITGYNADEFVHNHELLFDIVHPEDKDKFAEHIRKNYPDGGDDVVADFQFRIIDKQGSVKFISHTCSSIFDDKKNYLGRRGTNVDVTSRRGMEERLREANISLQLAIDGGELGTFDADLRKGKIKINDRYVEMLGYTPGEVEMTKEFWTSLIHQEDLAGVMELSNKIDSGEIESMEIEYRIKHKSGKWIWIVDKAKGFDYDLSGRPARSAGTHRDVTARKETEDALRQSEEKMRMIVEGTSFFFFYTQDAEGNLVYISPTVEKITGRKTEDWLNQRHWFATDNPINDKASRRTHQHLNGQIINEPFYFELKHGNGSNILLEVFENPIFEDGKVTGLQGIAHDITDRKSAEDALRKSEQKFRSIFENHSAVKLLIDPDSGKIIDANKAAADYYGWLIEELKRMNIQQINMLPSENVLSDMKKVKLDRQNHFEFRHIRKNGSIRDVEIYSSKIEIENKTYIHSIIHDITDRKLAEEELRNYRNHLEGLVKTRTEELDKLNSDLIEQLQKEKELEMMLRESLGKEKELSELKSRFISTASHEFRTPLTSILASAETIQRYGKKWPEEKYNDYLSKIRSSVKYLAVLLDEVLTISRSESGKILFSPLKLDLQKLCVKIIDEIKTYKTPAHNFDFCYRLTNTDFSLDPTLLRFILTNILTNAFKYSPQGGDVILTVDSEDDQIRITVSDKGIGIPQEDMKHLFETFHRAANTTDIPGTGLGLSIVKHAVDLHNGKIKVESTLGKGTKFIVTIPLV